MEIALWIVGGLAALLFLITGLLKLVVPKTRLRGLGMAWVEQFKGWQIKVFGVLEVLGAIGLAVGLLAPRGYAPLGWWLAALAATGLVIVMVGAVVVHLRRRETPVPAAVPGVLAVVAVVLAVLLATDWPGGVRAPSMAIPPNPIWTGDTKPEPVPEEHVVLEMPKDMYRHNGAPTEWWWHIGTLRAGERVFGFEINAASFIGQSFAMTQVSLSDVDSGRHYDRTQIYVAQPVGVFDVSTWAEGDPGKDWYARLGDPGWLVGGFSVTERGSGYTSPPTVRIEGGGGTGGAGIAVLGADGGIDMIALVNPGSGYTSPPTVTLEGGGGTGASAVAVRNHVSMTAPQADPTRDIHVQSTLVDEETLTEIEYDLTFSQEGRPFYEFGTGVNPTSTVQSLAEDNYYFSFTRLAASGTITIDGTAYEVSGTTWMDHEYGNFGSGGDGHIRWLLSDIQLDNGYTLTNPGLIGPGYKPEIGVAVDAQTTIQDPDGAIYFVAATLTPVGELWTSPRTGQTYAQQFRIDIPSFDASLTVTTRVQDQEFIVPGAPVYEGTADVEGRFLGKQVGGDAWMEQAF